MWTERERERVSSNEPDTQLSVSVAKYVKISCGFLANISAANEHVVCTISVYTCITGLYLHWAKQNLLPPSNFACCTWRTCTCMVEAHIHFRVNYYLQHAVGSGAWFSVKYPPPSKNSPQHISGIDRCRVHAISYFIHVHVQGFIWPKNFGRETRKV